MTQQRIFVFYTGEYEQRMIHSVHSAREEAVSVWERLQREYPSSDRGDPDIDEHVLDEDLCARCGYDEQLHIKNPDTWKHQFISSQQVKSPALHDPLDPEDVPR